MRAEEADPQSKDQVARALRLWTHEENLPILVHCIHGKDRTGLVIALLLFLIGVPIEVHLHMVCRCALATPLGLADCTRNSGPVGMSKHLAFSAAS